MAETSKYALRYPLDDDPVDVATDMQKLAEDIDIALSSGGSVIHGNGPPSADVGDAGSIYLDTDSGQFYGPKGAGDLILGGDNFDRPGTDVPPSSRWNQASDYPFSLGLRGDGSSAGIDPAAEPTQQFGGCVWNPADQTDVIWFPGDIDVWTKIADTRVGGTGDICLCVFIRVPDGSNALDQGIKLCIADDGWMYLVNGTLYESPYGQIQPRLIAGDEFALSLRGTTITPWVRRPGETWTQPEKNGIPMVWNIATMPPGTRLGLRTGRGFTIDSFSFGTISLDEIWPLISGPQFWLHDEGPPTANVGELDSIYLDTVAGEFWGPKMPGGVILGSDNFEKSGTTSPPPGWNKFLDRTVSFALSGDGHTAKTLVAGGFGSCYYINSRPAGDVDVWITIGDLPADTSMNWAVSIFARADISEASAIKLVLFSDGQMLTKLGNTELDYIPGPAWIKGEQVALRVLVSGTIEAWRCPPGGKWSLAGSSSFAAASLPPGQYAGLGIDNNYGWTIDSFALGTLDLVGDLPTTWPPAPIGGLVIGDPVPPPVIPPVTALMAINVPVGTVFDINWPPELPGVVTVAVSVGGGTIRGITWPKFDIGQICHIINPTSAPVTISHNDQQGAGWGFWMRDMAPLILNKDEAATFSWIYQTGGLGQFWREISRSKVT